MCKECKEKVAKNYNKLPGTLASSGYHYQLINTMGTTFEIMYYLGLSYQPPTNISFTTGIQVCLQS